MTGAPLIYWFAVVPDPLGPDDSCEPLAAFETLEEAFAWGSYRFRGGSFRLRRFPVQAAKAQELAAAVRTRQ